MLLRWALGAWQADNLTPFNPRSILKNGLQNDLGNLADD
jgi:hypothetical protein